MKMYKSKSKTFKCLNCERENNWSWSSTNKYCDNHCQHEYRWRTFTKPRIERGEATENSAPMLRKYLIETQGEFCAVCRCGTTWQERPLTLHIDHKDGDCENNHPSNLRLLCPNCHSQTATWGSKNTRPVDSKRRQYYLGRRSKY